MSNEWLNNLRNRMDDHEEEVPDGLWNDIRDELFSEKDENAIITGIIPIVGNEKEKSKETIAPKSGSRSLFYRIGGVTAAAVLVFMMIKLLPEDDNKIFSKKSSALNKELNSNERLKDVENQNNINVEGNSNIIISLAQHQLNTIKSEKKIKEIKFENVERKKSGSDENFQMITKVPDVIEPEAHNDKTPSENPLASESQGKKINEREAEEDIFKKEESKKFADNTKHKTSETKRKWMLGMLTGNASSNAAEQQFPGYASINGKPMDVEEVWSASEFVEDPLTQILLANQSQPVEARIRHRLPVTFGLSLYYNLGKRWGIGTGLNYTKLVSELHSGSDENYIKGDQTIHYVGIPVQVNYNVIQKGKFTGYVTGGALIEKPVSGSITTTYVVNDEVKESSKESLNKKPVQFSVNTAVGVQLKVIDRLGIYAEPGIGYHFKDEKAPNTFYKEKPLHFNVKFGIRLLID